MCLGFLGLCLETGEPADGWQVQLGEVGLEGEGDEGVGLAQG